MVGGVFGEVQHLGPVSEQRSLAPDARRPTPDARRPTPDARRPTPDARKLDIEHRTSDIERRASLEGLQRHLEKPAVARAFFLGRYRLRLARASRPRVEPAFVADAVALRVGPVAREEAEPDRGEPIARLEQFAGLAASIVIAIDPQEQLVVERVPFANCSCGL